MAHGAAGGGADGKRLSLVLRRRSLFSEIGGIENRDLFTRVSKFRPDTLYPVLEASSWHHFLPSRRCHRDQTGRTNGGDHIAS
jgi:hypothetical protein